MICKAPQALNRGGWYHLSFAPENGPLTVHKTLHNKQDRIENPEILKDMKADKTLKISAKTGQGLDDLKDELEKILRARSILLERVFPYEKAGLIQIVRAKGQLLEEEYRGDGIYVKAFVPAEIYGKVAY